MNLCSKPGCGQSGAVILGYDYSQRRIVLEDPRGGEISPHDYAMCFRCVDKLKPPRGWDIVDRRAKPPLFLDEVSAARVAREARVEEPEVTSSGHQLFFGSSV